MDLTADRVALTAAVSAVERVIDASSRIPVLSGLLLEAEEGELWLTGSNLDLTIKRRVTAQVSRGGRTVIDGRTLSGAVRRSPGETVRITADERSAVIASGSVRFTLETQSAADYPKLPEEEAAPSIRLPASDLATLIKRTAFAAADDGYERRLDGICIEVERHMVRFVATDSYQLAYQHCGAEASEVGDEKRRVLLPASSAKEILRSCDAEGSACLRLGASQVVIELPHGHIVSRMIDADFPDYRRVFPADIPSVAKVSRSAILAALERAAIIAASKPELVHLEQREGAIIVSSRESGVGEAYEEVPAETIGEAAENQYNARYLITALKTLDKPGVCLEIRPGRQPMGLRIDGESGYHYVIMPTVG